MLQVLIALQRLQIKTPTRYVPLLIILRFSPVHLGLVGRSVVFHFKSSNFFAYKLSIVPGAY
jgi:hypothetical protein